MNNKKMTDTAKTLDLIANIGGKLAAGFGIICMFLFFLSVVFGDKIFSDETVNLSLYLDFIKLHLNNDFYVEINYMKPYSLLLFFLAGFLSFSIFHLSTLLRKIFSPMKEGRPFEPCISSNLRKIGWFIFVYGGITEILKIFEEMLLVKAYSIDELFTSPLITHIEYIYRIDFTFVLFTCVMFLLSYIFNYGQKLQQDSDETI